MMVLQFQTESRRSHRWLSVRVGQRARPLSLLAGIACEPSQPQPDKFALPANARVERALLRRQCRARDWTIAVLPRSKMAWRLISPYRRRREPSFVAVVPLDPRSDRENLWLPSVSQLQTLSNRLHTE